MGTKGGGPNCTKITTDKGLLPAVREKIAPKCISSPPDRSDVCNAGCETTGPFRPCLGKDCGLKKNEKQCHASSSCCSWRKANTSVVYKDWTYQFIASQTVEVEV